MGIMTGMLTMGKPGGAVAPDPEVVAFFDTYAHYWTLDEGSGDRLDSIGDIDLTPTGTVGSAPGKLGNAATMTGTGNRLSKATQIDCPTTGFTVWGWIKISAAADTALLTCYKDSTKAWELIYTGNSWRFIVRDTDITTYVASTPQTLVTNAWKFMCGRYNPVTKRLEHRLDAEPWRVSTPLAKDPITGTTKIQIGGVGSGSNAAMDETGIANCYLTDSEVDDLYNSGKGRTYPFAGFRLNPNSPRLCTEVDPHDLVIPTYDGSGQAVHPDVLDFGEDGWNGYRYWMVMTPYPGGDATKENPSILVSNDKETWVVPNGLTNPIVPQPETGGLNSDPDLWYDSATGRLYCLWREFRAGRYERYYFSYSTDGVTWTPKTLTLDLPWESFLSPSLVQVGSTLYLYYARKTTPPTVERLSAPGIEGPWSEPVLTNLSGIDGVAHIDVIYDDALGLFFAYAPKNIFGFSSDGITWDFSSQLWSHNYRGSLVRTATGFDLFYSHFTTNPTVWYIGRSEIQWSPGRGV